MTESQKHRCFGVPSVFSFRSQVCSGCDHRSACQGAVRSALNDAPRTPAIVALIKQHDEAEVGTTEGLPKKVITALAKLARGGVKEGLQRALNEGRNPFNPDKHRSYHGAFELLRAGGFSRGELCAYFMGELGWAKSAAQPEVSLVWKLFPALGIAEDADFKLLPGPNVRSHNSIITN